MALPNFATGTPRIKPGRRDSLRQAIMLQHLAFDTALAFKAENTQDEKRLDAKGAVALANLIRAWDTLEERKRILRGRPLPGSLKPEKSKPRRKSAFLEPSEEPPV